MTGLVLLFFFEALLFVERDGPVGLKLLILLDVLADIIILALGGNSLGRAFLQVGQVRRDQIEAVKFGAVDTVAGQWVVEGALADFL